MNAEQFQWALRRAFDDKLEVRVDRRDNCMVIWDRSRSGVPYPVRKISCEEVPPHHQGVFREAYDRDIAWLRKRDWAEKYNRRKAAGAQIIDEIYRRPIAEGKRRQIQAIEETAKGPVKEYAEWRCGTKNTLSLAPIKDGGAGGMKNRHHDARRKTQRKLKEAGLQ